MALDVWVGKPNKLRGGPSVSFEPEAYYSFLFPLFEAFAQSNGKMIDSYDGAVFEKEELTLVLEFVEKAKKLVSAQSEEFDVFMGTNLGTYYKPKNEDIYHTVNRSEYLGFLEQLHAIVLEAQQSGNPLVFLGD